MNLAEDVLFLNKILNILEQKTLENNIEIVGVREVKQEKCLEIRSQITSKLNAELSVQNAHRVFSGNNNKSRKIVAALNSKENKRKIMKEARKLKLTAKQVCK